MKSVKSKVVNHQKLTTICKETFCKTQQRSWNQLNGLTGLLKSKSEPNELNCGGLISLHKLPITQISYQTTLTNPKMLI